MYVKHVAKRAELTPHTAITRPAVGLWQDPRVLSVRLKSPAPNVIDISVAKSVSRTTSKVPRKQNPFMSATDAAGPVSAQEKKRYCETCKRNREIGHLCYMRPLKDVLPANADKVLDVFYNFETTQNKRYSDTTKVYVPNLVCVQQFCACCEDVVGEIDCERCGKRRH